MLGDHKLGEHKAVIIPLSIYIDLDWRRTADAFARLGVGWLTARFDFMTGRLNEIINPYKAGKISTEEFRARIRARYPNAVGLRDDQAFDNAWNAMCVVTDETRAIIRQAQQLKSKHVAVYFFGYTNELQNNYLKQELGIKNFPGTGFFSHVQLKDEVLERNHLQQLRQKLLRNIGERFQGIKTQDIAYVYSRPQAPHTWWNSWYGFFAYVLDFFGMANYRAAQNSVNELQRTHQQNAQFSLLDMTGKTEQSLENCLTSDLRWDLSDLPRLTAKTPSEITFSKRDSKKRDPDYKQGSSSESDELSDESDNDSDHGASTSTAVRKRKVPKRSRTD